MASRTGLAAPVVLVRGDPAGPGGGEGGQLEGAGADAGAADGTGAALRDDITVVVRQQAGELGVGGLQRYDEGVRVGGAQRLGVDERGEDGGLRGGGRGVEDVAQGVGRVGGGEGPAVVEGDTAPEPEGPGAGGVVGLPGLGEVGCEVAVGSDPYEPVVEGAQVLVRGQRARRVEGLGVGGGRPGDAQSAAPVGPPGGRAGRHGVRGGGGRGAGAAGEQPGRAERGAGRRGCGEERAARHRGLRAPGGRGRSETGRPETDRGSEVSDRGMCRATFALFVQVNDWVKCVNDSHPPRPRQPLVLGT